MRPSNIWYRRRTQRGTGASDDRGCVPVTLLSLRVGTADGGLARCSTCSRTPKSCSPTGRRPRRANLSLLLDSCISLPAEKASLQVSWRGGMTFFHSSVKKLQRRLTSRRLLNGPKRRASSDEGSARAGSPEVVRAVFRRDLVVRD